MKPKQDQEKVVVNVRRYSDHPIVKKKVAEVQAMLDKADLSFLDNPPKKQ